MLEHLIDRLAVAHALRRCPVPADDDGLTLERWLPVFTSAGPRVGEPWHLCFDWSTLPWRRLASPAALEVLGRTLDALPARYRAAVLIDSEGVAPADVAAGLGEPPAVVRRRLHRVRSALRERLTAHFTADPPRHA